MVRQLIVETTFLIDLEREHDRGRLGPAISFLEANEHARLYLPVTVAGEMAAGMSLRDRARWESFLAPFFVLPSTPDVSWHYGQACRHLRDRGLSPRRRSAPYGVQRRRRTRPRSTPP